MKVIIMGCGRVGAQLAARLDNERHEVTILDINPRSFARLIPTFKGIALMGDGTDEDSLRKAEIEKADAFIAVAPEDNHNIMAAQIAKYIFNVSKVICRIYDPLCGELYESLGLEVVSPTTVVSQLLEERLVKRVK
jgi:trk system potassium uptake protein TrkA